MIKFRSPSFITGFFIGQQIYINNKYLKTNLTFFSEIVYRATFGGDQVASF